MLTRILQDGISNSDLHHTKKTYHTTHEKIENKTQQYWNQQREEKAITLIYSSLYTILFRSPLIVSFWAQTYLIFLVIFLSTDTIFPTLLQTKLVNKILIFLVYP